jgi:FkbM family methyltransferase
MNPAAKLTCIITRAKSFTFRLVAKNIRNIMPHLMVCFTPLGWITALLSASQLFGVRGLRNMLNPLWMVILSNLIIKRVSENHFLAYSPLKKVRFLASGWDAAYIFYHVWLCRDYERFVKPKGVIVDCGAHIGLFTLRCLRNLNATFVLAVEPNPLHTRLLRANLSMNRVVDRFMIVEAAAGPSNGEIKLYLDNLSSRSSVVKKTTRSVYVRQVKLDDLARLGKVDFIKIDVEGAELEVLKGASELIERDKPVLVIETSRENLRKLVGTLQNYRLCVSRFGGVHVVCLPHD